MYLGEHPYPTLDFPKSTGLRRKCETAFEHHSNAVRFTLCRFAPAYAFSMSDLNAATLSAITILPRKASRDPTFVLAFEASLFAYAYDTPPFGYAL